MKSSLALVIEQLLLLEPFRELHFGVVLLSVTVFSPLPLLLSVVPVAAGALVLDAVVVVVVIVVGTLAVALPALAASRTEPGGGDVCRGVNSELNGTSGITKSSSFTTTCLFTTKAPTFIVSLSDFEFSSL